MPYMVFFSANGEHDVEEYSELADAVASIEASFAGGRTFQRLIQIRDVPVELKMSVSIPSLKAPTDAAAPVAQAPVEEPSKALQDEPAPEAQDVAVPVAVAPRPVEDERQFATTAPHADLGIFGR